MTHIVLASHYTRGYQQINAPVGYQEVVYHSHKWPLLIVNTCQSADWVLMIKSLQFATQPHQNIVPNLHPAYA